MKNATESCSTLGAHHGQWTLVQKSDQVFTDGTFIPSFTPTYSHTFTPTYSHTFQGQGTFAEGDRRKQLLFEVMFIQVYLYTVHTPFIKFNEF